MGAIQSKSPLERRNTVLRRSQRKSVFGLKGKLDLLQKDIRRFKGVEEDEKFEKLNERLTSIKKEWRRAGKDLQKEIKGSYDGVKVKIAETEKILGSKIQENIEKQKMKESKKKKKGIEEVTSNVDEAESDGDLESDVFSQVESQVSRIGDEENKRKTVEIKSVRVIPDESDSRVQSPIQSPQSFEKRKSILKMGVAVMPNAMLQEKHRKHTVSICSNGENEEIKPKNQEEHLEFIIDKLRKIEFSINTFNGLKGQDDYTRIKEELQYCRTDLDAMEVNRDTYDKWNETNQYCKSCNNFLDEKAKENAEPKMPRTSNLSQYKSNEELNEAYSKLTKSTDV